MLDHDFTIQADSGNEAPTLKREQAARAEVKRKIKILYIIDSLSNVGGAELCLLRLTKHLPRDEFDCRVLTFYSRPGEGALPSQFDCPVDHWQVNNIYDRNAFAVGRRLAQMVREEKFDIVHTFFQISDIWAGTISKMSGAKVLISSRRDMGILRERKHSIGYRLSRGMVDQIQTVSESVRRWTVENDRVDPTRTITIHNGIDTKLSVSAAEVELVRRNLKIEPGTPVVTTVANFRWIKGIDVLTRAAALVVKQVPNVRFLVAGGLGFNPVGRAYADSVKDLAGQLGVAKSIQFLGQIDNVLAVLGASDLFVLPSRSEGLSNALLEAMLSGLPCVATSVGGNPEVVVDGETGYLVPPETPARLAEQILKLLGDRNLRLQMGQLSRERVEHEFSLEIMASRVTAAYRHALNKKHQEKTLEPTARLVPPAASIPMDRLGFSIIEKIASFGGVNKVIRNSLLHDRMLVLCYHGVLSEAPRYQHAFAINVMADEFERHMRFLSKNFHLLSAFELDAVIRGEQKLAARSVLVTFDDGYYNNLTNAVPILRAYGVPAIFNVPTDYIGTNQLLWPDEIFLRALEWPEPRFPSLGGEMVVLPRDRNGRMRFATRLQENCKLLKDRLRVEYIHRLRQGSELPEGAHAAEEYRFLSWDDVRELKRQKFEIGSHTVTHPILSRLSPQSLEQELTTSKNRLERELNAECRVIAYPNGRGQDVGPETCCAAAKVGYRMGFTLQGRLANKTNPMAIDRINIPGNVPQAMFESRAGGLYLIGGAKSLG